MPIATWFAVYFVLWWLCLFAVLPFGARNQSDTGEVVTGTEPGAPAVLKLWRLLLANTVLSGVMLLVLKWGLSLPVVVEYWR